MFSDVHVNVMFNLGLQYLNQSITKIFILQIDLVTQIGILSKSFDATLRFSRFIRPDITSGSSLIWFFETFKLFKQVFHIEIYSGIFVIMLLLMLNVDRRKSVNNYIGSSVILLSLKVKLTSYKRENTS